MKLFNQQTITDKIFHHSEAKNVKYFSKKYHLLSETKFSRIINTDSNASLSIK